MKILITGSVAFDYLMTFPGKFQEHILPDQLESISLSFLVDSLVRRRGGIAPNIAFTMAMLGGSPKIFATVGEDFEDYRVWLESKNVDTSLVKTIEGKHTASFFATTDQENSQIASFYPGAMENAAELSLKDLGSEAIPDIVMVSPNDPRAMDKYIQECKELNYKYIYDPSQQVVRVSGDEIKSGIEGAIGLFVNDYENSLVKKKTRLSEENMSDNLEFMVITKGDVGSVVISKNEEWHVNAVAPTKIVDPTGAGDAYRAGFLTGYSHSWAYEMCAEMGSLAATYCLENDGPQGHHFTVPEFISRFREHFDDEEKLDTLL